jgi:hypothetical protein
MSGAADAADAWVQMLGCEIDLKLMASQFDGGQVNNQSGWVDANTGKAVRVLASADKIATGSRNGPGVGDLVAGLIAGAKTAQIKAALSEGTDSAGGFSIPQIVLPQFIDPKAPFLPQMTVFGATFITLAFLNAFGYALVASRARGLAGNPAAIRWFNRAGGTLLIGAGVAAAAARQRAVMLDNHDALHLYHQLWDAARLRVVPPGEPYYADAPTATLHVPCGFDDAQLVAFVRRHFPRMAARALARASAEAAGKGGRRAAHA